MEKFKTSKFLFSILRGVNIVLDTSKVKPNLKKKQQQQQLKKKTPKKTKNNNLISSGLYTLMNDTEGRAAKDDHQWNAPLRIKMLQSMPRVYS